MPPPYPFGQRQQSEGWKEERILGSGGFGTVTLWKHEVSKFYVLHGVEIQLNLIP